MVYALYSPWEGSNPIPYDAGEISPKANTLARGHYRDLTAQLASSYREYPPHRTKSHAHSLAWIVRLAPITSSYRKLYLANIVRTNRSQAYPIAGSPPQPPIKPRTTTLRSHRPATQLTRPKKTRALAYNSRIHTERNIKLRLASPGTNTKLRSYYRTPTRSKRTTYGT